MLSNMSFMPCSFSFFITQFQRFRKCLVTFRGILQIVVSVSIVQGYPFRTYKELSDNYTLYFISNARLKFAKNQAKAKQHLDAELCNLKIIRFLHPRYHPKIIGDILKNVQKQVFVYKYLFCLDEVIMINDNQNEAEDRKQVTEIRDKQTQARHVQVQ